MSQICNSDNVIASRDIIARMEELQAERETLADAVTEAEEAGDVEAAYAREELKAWDDSDEAEELKTLEALNEEGEQNSGDWTHGETLIHGSYWVEYVQELVSDIGDLPRNIPSYIEIDWEATARNIAADYSQIDFDGSTYYIRNS